MVGLGRLMLFGGAGASTSTAADRTTWEGTRLSGLCWLGSSKSRKRTAAATAAWTKYIGAWPCSHRQQSHRPHAYNRAVRTFVGVLTMDRCDAVMLLLQDAGSSKRRRAAAAGSAAGAEESGQSGGLSDEAESSEEGTSGVKPKAAAGKKRANARKPSHPLRSAVDEGSTGSDAKKVCVST